MDYMKSRWLMNRTETVLCFKVCLTWRVECYTKCVVKMIGDNVGDRFLMLKKYFRSWFHLQKIFFHQT